MDSLLIHHKKKSSTETYPALIEAADADSADLSFAYRICTSPLNSGVPVNPRSARSASLK